MSFPRHYDLMSRNEHLLGIYFTGNYFYRARPLESAPWNWPISYGPPMQMIVVEWDWLPFDGRERGWRGPANFYRERGQDVIVISKEGSLKLDDRRDALKFIATQHGVTLRPGERETLLALREPDFWRRVADAISDKEFRDLPADIVDAFKEYGVFWMFFSLFSDYQETIRLFEPIRLHYKRIFMMLWSMMIKAQDPASRNVAPGYMKALLKNRKHIPTFKRALYRYLDSAMDEAAFRRLLAECATRNQPTKASYGSIQDDIVWMEEPWFLDLLTAKRSGWFATHEELEERVRERPRRSSKDVVMEACGSVIPAWNPT